EAPKVCYYCEKEGHIKKEYNELKDSIEARRLLKEAKLQKKEGANTHKTSTPSPIFSPNNSYIQDSLMNTEGEAQTEVAETTDVLTPNNTGLVPQKMEIEIAEESDKPTPTTSEMEILTDSKEPSSTQSTLQEIPFTVSSRDRLTGRTGAKEPTLRLLPLS
ncbi:18717_t:CDS:2, partial [Gigaspora rosea]